jgi:hypothetical protein
MENKRVTIIVPIDKYERLEAIAEDEYRTISSYFLQWLNEFLDMKEQKEIKDK